MSLDALRKGWRAVEATARLYDKPSFEPNGLVLGAGAVLAEAGRAASNERLEALLAVAYGRETARRSLGHVQSAASRWAEGDRTRAELHLALARLDRLQPHAALATPSPAEPHRMAGPCSMIAASKTAR